MNTFILIQLFWYVYSTLSLISVNSGFSEPGTYLIAHVSKHSRICQVDGKSENKDICLFQLPSMDYTTSTLDLSQKAEK